MEAKADGLGGREGRRKRTKKESMCIYFEVFVASFGCLFYLLINFVLFLSVFSR